MSSQSSESKGQAPAADNGKKKLFPWDRIVLLVVLVVVLVLMVIDYRARWQFESALTAISQYLPENEELAERNPIELDKNPTREQVLQMIGQEPDEGSRRDLIGGVYDETFSWKGVFRTFRLRVGYRRVFEQDRLDRVETVDGKEIAPSAPAPAQPRAAPNEV